MVEFGPFTKDVIHLRIQVHDKLGELHHSPRLPRPSLATVTFLPFMTVRWRVLIIKRATGCYPV